MKRKKTRLGCVENVLFVMLCIVGFSLFIHTKKQMNLYQSHEWITVEAVYNSSDSYSVSTDDGVETRYRWNYIYEVDGQVYDCVDDIEHTGPGSGGTIKIMVATDDNSIYMLYGSEEEFKASYKLLKRLNVYFWIILFLVGFGFKFVIEKIAQRKNREKH